MPVKKVCYIAYAQIMASMLINHSNDSYMKLIMGKKKDTKT